jgi:hypothetical protein
MRCRGITRNGTQCSLSTVGSDCYCARHVLTRMPTVPAAVGWPSLASIEGHLPKDPIRWIKTTTERRVPLDPYQFLMLTLILLANPEVAAKVQNIVNSCMDNMTTVPHLAHYREYFGRKLSRRHREQAIARRKAHIHRTLAASDLGVDIADVVAYLADNPRPSPY